MTILVVAIVSAAFLQVALAGVKNETKAGVKRDPNKCVDSHPQCKRLCASNCINPATNERGPTCKEFFGLTYNLLQVFCPKSCNACSTVNEGWNKVDKFMISACGKPKPSGLAALVGETHTDCGKQTRFRDKETSGPYAGKAVFNLCFRNGGYETEKGWIMQGAQKWMDESCANVVLLRGDDNNCDNNIDGVIPIQFVNGRPYCRYSFTYPSAGAKCTFKKYEIDLRPTFTNANCMKSENDRMNCIIQNAMHEFGHLLGFGHEQEQDESDCDQRDPADHPVVALTEYDPDSIMNYCNMPSWSNPKLSSTDIRGAQQAYGSSC